MSTCRSTRFRLIVLASSLAVAALAPAGAVADIVVISRESTLAVNGIGQDVPFDDSASFNELGTFTAGVAGQEGDAPDGFHARGAASQNTTLTLNPSGDLLSGSGRLDADAFARTGVGLNQVSVDNLLRVVFEVTDSNEPFNASGEFDGLFPGGTALFFLSETSQPPPGFGAITFSADNDSELQMETTFSSGLLSLRPATYTLTIGSGAGSSGTGPGGIEPFGHESGVNFNFTLGQAEPPPPPVIPLPAGVWAGMLGLTAAAGAIKNARRVRRQR
jgi:hypothetical protein